MSQPLPFSLEPSRDKAVLRKQLQAERQAMVDRHQRAVHLQEVLRVWLVSRGENSVGAYWPIKGEFDALPALFRWTEGETDTKRQIGLPVSPRTPTPSNRNSCWCPASASARAGSGWGMEVASTTARWPI
jgi:5-formyltetrahydrofolate cyclo-ligase